MSPYLRGPLHYDRYTNDTVGFGLRPHGAGVLHHGMFAVDIVGFGLRPPSVHPYLRASLYAVVGDAFAAAGIPLDACHHEDRGDGILVVIPPDSSVELLLGPLPERLRDGVRRHNRLAALTARLQIRTAVNAGYAHTDPHGVSGRAVIDLFRLLDAAAFKDLVREREPDLALIIGHRLYRDLVCDSPWLLDPEDYLPLAVTTKETSGTAWVRFCPDAGPRSRPDHPVVFGEDGTASLR